jgi:hypothetical protein
MIAISLICWILAAICNAVMDVCSHHFEGSIFNSRMFNACWWKTEYSWTNKYILHNPKNGRRRWFYGLLLVPVQITDSFHFFKMLMIIFLACSVGFAYNVTHNPGLILLVIGFYGLCWNVWFSLFYNKVFMK